MTTSALFSEDRSRRYELIRDWRDEIGAPDKTALFVMLNPSVAGESEDDPTIRKVVGFAKRWGYGRAVVVNLNPVVSTDPWKLPPWNGIDLTNRTIVEQWIAKADLLVAAWGSQPAGLSRIIGLSELAQSFREICRDYRLHCIGVTGRGAPLHPSRARYTQEPELWVRE